METTIYALKLKGVNKSIFYIGRTNDINKRLLTHNASCNNTYVGRFLIFLKEINVEFEHEIVKVVHKDFAHYVETSVINRFAIQGYLLMNQKHNPYTTHLDLF